MSSPDMRGFNTRMRELEGQMGVGRMTKGIGIGILWFIIFVILSAGCGSVVPVLLLFIILFLRGTLDDLLNQ